MTPPETPESEPTMPPPTDPASGPRPTGPNPAGTGPGSNEAPDRDTPAWEGAEPDEPVALVDPRHEIRTPPGL